MSSTQSNRHNRLPRPFTRLSVCPFTLKELERLELLDDERHYVEEWAPFFQEMAGSGTNRYCGIAIYNGVPLYMGGYYEDSDRPGVAQVFFFIDKRGLKYPKQLVRTVRLWGSWIEGRPWVERVETKSLATKRIDRWMEALGFVCEITLKGYTEAGQDYRLWSRDKVDGVWGTIRRRGSKGSVSAD